MVESRQIMTQAGAITTSSFAAAIPAVQSARPTPPVILHERWPTLAAAMGQYQQTLAEEFSRRAYACVREGLISGTDRHHLARDAAELGLRPFDAQLLIACAIRQWSLDQPHLRRKKAMPARRAVLRPIAQREWMRYVVIGILAVAIDAAIIALWLR